MDSRAFCFPSRNHLVVTLDPAETNRHRQASSTQVGQHKPAMLGIMETLQSLSACLGAGFFAPRSSVLSCGGSFAQPAAYSATPPPGLYCEPFIPRPARHSGKLGTCEVARPFPLQGNHLLQNVAVGSVFTFASTVVGLVTSLYDVLFGLKVGGPQR